MAPEGVGGAWGRGEGGRKRTRHGKREGMGGVLGDREGRGGGTRRRVGMGAARGHP